MRWLWLIAALAILGGLATRDLWSPGRREPARPQETAAAAPPALAPAGPCRPAPSFAEQARANARSHQFLQWSPFGVAEQGWQAYAPTIAAEIATTCGPADTGFAAAMAAWQSANGLPPTGLVDPASVEKMRVTWMLRRPFVVQTRDGTCPPGADRAGLATARTEEGYGGRTVELEAGALEAWRRMREAARRDMPEAASDPKLLALISGYRDPVAEEERCQTSGDCGGPARARCSAHRTGRAIDLYLGAAPGAEPTSSSDANRSFQASTPVYRWLVRNGARFGFVPYPYEPWHWEWTGEAPR